MLVKEKKRISKLYVWLVVREEMCNVFSMPNSNVKIRMITEIDAANVTLWSKKIFSFPQNLYC